MVTGNAMALDPSPPPGAVVMDGSEYQRWVDLLERRTGVVVPPARQSFLETNLRLRLAELGYDDLKRYHDECLVGPAGAREWAVLVDRLTIHESRFFRHLPSLALVTETVLSEFLARPAADAASFHAWSVGCATGEEVYSLAMVIDRCAQEQSRPFHYGVTGSDVSQPALAVGRGGVYPNARAAEIPPEYRQAYLTPVDGSHFAIAARLQSRVGFAVLNLLDVRRAPMTQLDLIFCHNVLIYFPRVRRFEVLNHLVRCLRPGGCLVLGPGDVSTWSHPEMERISAPRTLAYRRTAKDAML